MNQLFKADHGGPPRGWFPSPSGAAERAGKQSIEIGTRWSKPIFAAHVWQWWGCFSQSGFNKPIVLSTGTSNLLIFWLIIHSCVGAKLSNYCKMHCSLAVLQPLQNKDPRLIAEALVWYSHFRPPWLSAVVTVIISAAFSKLQQTKSFIKTTVAI